MKDLMLKGAVKLDSLRSRAMERDNEEGADIVQTILIIAAFVVIVIFVFNVLYPAIAGQAENVGDCISGMNGGTGACQDFR